MLTKEECINALSDLKNRLEDILGEESENIECVNVLNQLIDEHFKLVTKYDLALNELVEMEMKLDNPPLGFEELKTNMWVWDNEDKKYNKIIEINGDKISFYYITSDVMRYICKFEPNRFYRKEIKDVD